MATENNEITVSDIEYKLIERMELLEAKGSRERLDELGLLLGWILNDEDY